MPSEQTSAKMLRLFVAIELPDAVRDGLARAADSLRRVLPPDALRWVRPEGIHITLKFLGPVEEGRVPALHTALRIAVREIAPFELSTGDVGSFGGRRNVRVVWVGVGGDTGSLGALAERVEDALGPLGFPGEQRPFAAHLTLARVREGTLPAVREQIYVALSQPRPAESPSFRVKRVSLMRSTLGRCGALYDALGSYPLAGVADAT